jgi:hypothetical protein
MISRSTCMGSSLSIGYALDSYKDMMAVILVPVSDLLLVKLRSDIDAHPTSQNTSLAIVSQTAHFGSV